MSEQALLMQRIAEAALADWHEEQRVKRDPNTVQADNPMRERVQNKIKLGGEKEGAK